MSELQIVNMSMDRAVMAYDECFAAKMFNRLVYLSLITRNIIEVTFNAKKINVVPLII